LKNFINSGIGIDLVQIQRFKQLSFSNNQSFYKKNFSEAEINYCMKFNEPYKHFAAKFALKEALIKSIDKNIHLSQIETSHLNSKPIVRIVKNEESYRFFASVTHENEFAIAVVICEKLK
tara:strand:+ start:2002 stop:2361 length:360 start_codon:yes stop_codon:yes gene_type:complete